MFVWASLDITNNAPTADLNVLCSLGGSAHKNMSVFSTPVTGLQYHMFLF
jgi:hypothetical protein